MTCLVAVHGFMGGSAQWDPQIEGVGDRLDIQVVDLPGFGKNAHLPVLNRIEAFADWVLDALRERGITRYWLMGHSMGGMIVQEMMRRDPSGVEKLILYGTGPKGLLPGRFETIEQSKSRAQQDGAEATARRISATWFLQEENSSAYPSCAEIAAQSAPQALPAGLDAMAAWDAESDLAKINCETLVLWGDCDRTYKWAQTEALWKQIPNCRLAVVPGCAHAVHLEKPELFNAILLDFLLEPLRID